MQHYHSGHLIFMGAHVMGWVGRSVDRLEHLIRFYAILRQLERNSGGARRLADCSGRMNWPKRGVYFFYEVGENRTDTGIGLRVVRVGTHALKVGSSTSLWTRLSQHKGQTRGGGGNHRGSIFRLLVGTALIQRDGYECPTWGMGNTASQEVRASERGLEIAVGRVVGDMPFLWLAINDEPRPTSLRGYIERNVIALLSNYDKPPLDAPSRAWLGQYCGRERVRESGLWNQNHVDDAYDAAFLDTFEQLVTGR